MQGCSDRLTVVANWVPENRVLKTRNVCKYACMGWQYNTLWWVLHCSWYKIMPVMYTGQSSGESVLSKMCHGGWHVRNEDRNPCGTETGIFWDNYINTIYGFWCLGSLNCQVISSHGCNSSDAGDGIFWFGDQNAQQAWYWLGRTDNMYSCSRINFIYLCQAKPKIWFKIWIYLL